jgi:predicted GNAT family N-acyltransferase
LGAKPQYIVQPLGKQNRAAFHCGDEPLDKYFLERASRDVRENLSAVFVLLVVSAPDAVLGYYTLSTLRIDTGDIPDELRKRTGRYKNVGAILIGRLAVAKEHPGKGLGEILLMDALKKSLDSTKNIAAFAVVVDAIDEKAEAFYGKYGFMPLHENRLFFPMTAIQQLFESQSFIYL